MKEGLDIARLAALDGPLHGQAAAAAGRDVVDHNIGTWRAMLTVLETGEHCPHHLRARKPERGGVTCDLQTRTGTAWTALNQ